MSTSRSEPAIAHVYAPRYPQEAIEIIGSRLGLERLVNVLIDAISVGKGTGEVSVSDGAVHEIRATCLAGRRRAEDWLRSGSPYWDVTDPFVARILDLTEENRRLRESIAALRLERKVIVNVDPLVGSDPGDSGVSPKG